MKIEVFAHETQGISRIEVDVAQTATVATVLAAAGLGSGCEGHVGMYGRLCGLGEAVTEGARIELYRPLLADPKQVRRQRARVRRPQA